MKITKQDIKTLRKIKSMCENTECENCRLALDRDCLLCDMPCWWHLELIQVERHSRK